MKKPLAVLLAITLGWMLLFRKLNSGCFMVQPYAKIRKAQFRQGSLAFFYFFQKFFRNELSGGNSGCKAGVGRLFPGKKAGLSGKSPDFCFGEAAFSQGGQYL